MMKAQQMKYRFALLFVTLLVGLSAQAQLKARPSNLSVQKASCTLGRDGRTLGFENSTITLSEKTQQALCEIIRFKNYRFLAVTRLSHLSDYRGDSKASMVYDVFLETKDSKWTSLESLPLEGMTPRWKLFTDRKKGQSVLTLQYFEGNELFLARFLDEEKALLLDWVAEARSRGWPLDP